MKKKNKLMLILLFVIIIGLVITFFIIKNRTLLGRTKIISNYKFNNVKINKKDDIYYFSVDITKDDKAKEIGSIDIIIMDKSANIIDNISVGITDLQNNKAKTIKVPSSKDLSKAYSVNYVVYKE